MLKLEFGKHNGGGIPLLDLNNKILGWVCSTNNGKWCYICRHRQDSPNFDSIEEAKNALLQDIKTQIYGE